MPTDQQVHARREVPHLRHDTIERFARTTTSGTAKQSDRALRFLARVDSHLITLPDYTAQRAFLDRQIEGWQWRYARFIATEGESESIVIPADPPQAADFLLTITGLMARRSALETQASAHA
jgi:hypothetical protein